MPTERVLDNAGMELHNDDVARLPPVHRGAMNGVRIETVAVGRIAR